MRTKFVLDQDERVTSWYNVLADLPESLPPALNPGTQKPLTPEDLAPLFPLELIKQYSPEMTVVLPADNFNKSLEKLPLPYRKVNGTVEIKTNDVNTCLDLLISRSVDLSDLTVRSPSLESVFLNLTGRQLRD